MSVTKKDNKAMMLSKEAKFYITETAQQTLFPWPDKQPSWQMPTSLKKFGLPCRDNAYSTYTGTHSYCRLDNTPSVDALALCKMYKLSGNMPTTSAAKRAEMNLWKYRTKNTIRRGSLREGEKDH